MTDDLPSTGAYGSPEEWTPPPPPEQPSSIRLAVRLMWVGAALSLIFAVLGFIQRDAIRDAFEDDENLDMTADEIDTAVNFFVGFSLFMGIVIAGLWLWMAKTNGDGKTWARIVATILGGLNLVLTLFGLSGPQTALGLIFSFVEVVLAAWILWLLYRPESTRFYELNTAQPRY